MRPKYIHASYPIPSHRTRSTCIATEAVVQRKWEVVQKRRGVVQRKNDREGSDVDRKGGNRNESYDEGAVIVHA